MRNLLMAALLAVASAASHAGGLVELGHWVAVQPAGDGAPVVRVRASMAAADHGEQLQLTARTPIDSRLLILPASAADTLHQALQKAQRWAQVARDNRADVVKPLACIGSDPTGACSETGAAIGANQIGLIFTATDDGQTSALLVSFRSGAGAVQRSVFYLDATSLPKLTDQLGSWPQGLASARKQQKSSGLFN